MPQGLVALFLLVTELRDERFFASDELHLPAELRIHLALERSLLFLRPAQLLLNIGVVAIEALLDDCFALWFHHRFHLIANPLCRLFPRLKLLAVLGDLVFRPHHNVVVGLGVGEERLQPVVVGLQDRIELVVVTLGAAVGHAQKCLSDDVGDVLEDFLPSQPQVRRVGFVGIVSVEGGRHARPMVVGPQFVAGDLFADEAVIRLVFVKGVDDVVAIAPGVGTGLVGLESFAFGIAGQVEPVARPALAVMWRVEQAIDDRLERFRGVVVEEGLHFFRCRRQPDEVEIRAAD